MRDFHHFAQLRCLLLLVSLAHAQDIVFSGCRAGGLVRRRCRVIGSSSRRFVLLCGSRPSLILLLELFKHLDRLPVQLLVALDHEALEGEEVIHSHDLINNLLMDRISASFVTRRYELLVTDAQLGHELGEQILDDLLEVLFAGKSNTAKRLHFCIGATYIVNFSELQLVFILVIENGAILVNEAHDGRFPSR